MADMTDSLEMVVSFLDNCNNVFVTVIVWLRVHFVILKFARVRFFIGKWNSSFMKENFDLEREKHMITY